MSIASDLSGSLLDDGASPLGSPLRIVTAGERFPHGAIGIGVDQVGALPEVDPEAYDALVTTAPGAPSPWVSIPSTRLDAQLAHIHRQVARAPIAATILARMLRLGEKSQFEAALEVESLAYSTLLGGAEFARWLCARAGHGTSEQGRVDYARVGDTVLLTLAAPANRNAMSAAMRDALYEALVNVLEDPSEPRLILRGEGRCFSVGGDLAEFGTAEDLAAAHVIRTRRSCAQLLNRLGARATVWLHGACIGSGAEIAAAAHRRVGAPDTFVQLPELAMGLIPGAGGTATLPRAVGRHRTAWLALGGFRLPAQTAHAWGLLHAITP